MVSQIFLNGRWKLLVFSVPSARSLKVGHRKLLDLLLPEPGATLNRFQIKLPNHEFVEFYDLIL
jgi:hypothetical protein